MSLDGMRRDILNSSDKYKILLQVHVEDLFKRHGGMQTDRNVNAFFTYEVWSYFNEEWIKNFYYLRNFRREGKEREIILQTFH